MLHKIISFFCEEDMKDIDVYALMNEDIQDRNTSEQNKKMVSNTSVTTNTIFMTKVDPDQYLKKQNTVIADIHYKF